VRLVCVVVNGFAVNGVILRMDGIRCGEHVAKLVGLFLLVFL
jgi:hypothetical protein